MFSDSPLINSPTHITAATTTPDPRRLQYRLHIPIYKNDQNLSSSLTVKMKLQLFYKNHTKNTSL